MSSKHVFYGINSWLPVESSKRFGILIINNYSRYSRKIEACMRRFLFMGYEQKLTNKLSLRKYCISGYRILDGLLHKRSMLMKKSLKMVSILRNRKKNSNPIRNKAYGVTAFTELRKELKKGNSRLIKKVTT